MKLFELFFIFFKLGLFTFGGGYAMIPQIKDVIVEKKKWMSNDEMLEIIAISESTPGPIAINMATYIGYKRGNVIGSVLSTLGVIIPSLTIIFLISLFLDQFMENIYVQYAFVGIKSCVGFLILKSGIELFIKSSKSFLNICLFSLTLIILILLNLFSISFSSIYFIIVGGLTGVIFYTLKNKKRRGE